MPADGGQESLQLRLKLLVEGDAVLAFSTMSADGLPTGCCGGQRCSPSDERVAGPDPMSSSRRATLLLDVGAEEESTALQLVPGSRGRAGDIRCGVLARRLPLADEALG
jgi:hypothetical protein